ncbi:MAG: NUDIX hydrolase [Alphaproteobacteria bacterium]
MAGSSPTLVLGVGAVIWNACGEVLLIRRARAPHAGKWSIPGGKVEPGESLHEALKREVREETGIEIEIGALAGVAELSEDLSHYVLIDFTARHASGNLHAGSDAIDVCWVSPRELMQFDLWKETRRIIENSARELLTGE